MVGDSEIEARNTAKPGRRGKKKMSKQYLRCLEIYKIALARAYSLISLVAVAVAVVLESSGS